MSGFVALMIWTMLYFWPTAVALNKKRANTGAVFMLNLFLGFTIIGWIVALCWAMTNTVSEEQKAAIMASAMADEMQRRDSVK